jgi:hypothetical protein
VPDQLRNQLLCQQQRPQSELITQAGFLQSLFDKGKAVLQGLPIFNGKAFLFIQKLSDLVLSLSTSIFPQSSGRNCRQEFTPLPSAALYSKDV